jgi:hypothetical protein
MAVSITPTNPGLVSDPRLNAANQYWAAVQKDLNAQKSEIGNPNDPIGNWQPLTPAMGPPREFHAGHKYNLWPGSGTVVKGVPGD